jgi:hypothetical protein
VRKKVSTFCVSKKVRSEGSPFFHLFFNRGIFWQYPNDREQVQNLHTTFRRREGKKKVTYLLVDFFDDSVKNSTSTQRPNFDVF